MQVKSDSKNGSNSEMGSQEKTHNNIKHNPYQRHNYTQKYENRLG